ncbi:uncharacterized protein BO80DRAFT_484282 [Aspergillus ibericus CBS 121593]|uniref:Uncharacterized protein n=1 Tax=Aspergillus ibericus CBS 121593 TaxID=1448316 RepID=A0A395GMB2_9EURO|nr:hypothetical protein BO80DRAFT_484282 [Aspergillus ibericus CBS 121593]RAK96524.1 hypothetical protein BO80DRAFT_484282 [Aspergillus ibericus CBS 121593]
MSFLPLVDDKFENPPFDPAIQVAGNKEESKQGQDTQASSSEDPVDSLAAKLEASDMVPGQEPKDGPPCCLPSNTSAQNTPVLNQDPMQDDASCAETMSADYDYTTPHEEANAAPLPAFDIIVPDIAVHGPTSDYGGADCEMDKTVGDADVTPIQEDHDVTPCNELSPEASKPDTMVAKEMLASQEDQDIAQTLPSSEQSPPASTGNRVPAMSEIRPGEDVTRIIGRINAMVTSSMEDLPMSPAQDNSSPINGSTNPPANVSNAPMDDANEGVFERVVLTYSQPTEARVRVRGRASVDVATTPDPLPGLKSTISNTNYETTTAATQPTRSARITYSQDSETRVKYTGYARQVEIIWRR